MLQVQELTPKVDECSEAFDHDAVAGALFGLQSMGAEDPEVLLGECENQDRPPRVLLGDMLKSK